MPASLSPGWHDLIWLLLREQGVEHPSGGYVLPPVLLVLTRNWGRAVPGASTGGPRNLLIAREIGRATCRHLSGGRCRSPQCGTTTLKGYRGVSDPLLLSYGPLRGPSKGVAHARIRRKGFRTMWAHRERGSFRTACAGQ